MKTNIHFFVTSRSFIPRMKNDSDKSSAKNRNTHFVLNNVFFFLNLTVYEIIWKNLYSQAGHR